MRASYGMYFMSLQSQLSAAISYVGLCVLSCYNRRWYKEFLLYIIIVVVGVGREESEIFVRHAWLYNNYSLDVVISRILFHVLLLHHRINIVDITRANHTEG